MTSAWYRVTVIMSLLGFAASGHGFLLVNGSFEDPPDFGDGKGWESFSDPGPGSVSREDWANGAPGTDDGSGLKYGLLGDGLFGLAFHSWESTGGGFYQDVQVEPGRIYSFDIESHAGCNAPVFLIFGSTVSINFEWYDGDPTDGGALISTDTNVFTDLDVVDGGCDTETPPGPEVPANWQQWHFDVTAPAGAAYLRPVVAWDGLGETVTGGSEAIRWDNAVLTTDLDPINETQSETDRIVGLEFDTQTGVVYTAEYTVNFVDWYPAFLPTVAGDDTIQQLYDLGEDAMRFYRLAGERD